MPISVVHTTVANSTSVTIPATTAGNCLVVCVCSENNTAAATVSGITLGGSAGNFAQLIDANGNDGSGDFTDAIIWADPNCAGGQTSVVISGTNLNVSSGAGGVFVFEVSGLATSSVLDQSHGGPNGTNSSASWTSGTTGTTSQASEIWIGCAVTFNTISGPGAPWTTSTDPGGFSCAGQQIVSSTGTATFSGTQSGAATWAAAVVTLKAPAGGGGPSGTIQPRATVAVPRRRPVRGLWQRITGQAFVKVPAPAQQPRPAPRRVPARAVVRFTPVTTANAAPSGPPAGTVQPRATIPVPRRRPARAVSRGTAVPGIYGTAPAQQPRAAPRRTPARAYIRFKPVTTTNAPPPARNLLISLASKAGTDDYGNAFPQGILATAGVIKGPEFDGTDFTLNSSGLFIYSGTPALGNLIVSLAAAAGTDSFGNAYVQGAATYVTISGTRYALEVGAQTGSGNAFLVHNLTNPPSSDPLFSAISASPAGCVAAIQSGKSTAGSGQAAVEVADSTASGVSGGEIDLVCGKSILNNSGSPIPIAGISTGIATLPQDGNSGSSWAAGERAFMNSNWVDNINGNFQTIVNALISAGIIT